jgi:hypothetical protein
MAAILSALKPANSSAWESGFSAEQPWSTAMKNRQLRLF